MSKQKNDISQVKKYLEGKLDSPAMHKLERNALDDPFLADAIDGYAIAGKEQQGNLADLSNRLQNRVDKKMRRIVPWVQLSAAASLLIIIGIGAWLMLRNQPDKQRKIVAAVLKEKKEQPVITTPSPFASQRDRDSIETVAKARANKNAQALASSKHAQKAEMSADNVAVDRDASGNQSLAEVSVAPPADDQKPVVKADQSIAKSKDALSEVIVQSEVAKKPAATPNSILVKKAPQQNPETQLQAHVDELDIQPAHKNLTGYVVGEDNQPLIGAVVKLAGANFGVVTDANGKFVMHDVPEKKNLVVGYMGYNTKQVRLNSSDSVKIALQPSGSQLSEVVVTNPSTQKDKNESPDAHPSAGWKVLKDYLDKNAMSPDGKTGKVKLSFMVDTKGALSGFKITKSLSDSADKKAIELVTNGPAWTGNIDGQPHEVKVTVKFH